MRKRSDFPADAEITRLCHRVSQPDGKRYGHMRRDLQYFLYIRLDGTGKDAHDLETNPELFSHQPHVLHHAAKTEYAQYISLRCRSPFPRITHNNKECRAALHRLVQCPGGRVLYCPLDRKSVV